MAAAGAANDDIGELPGSERGDVARRVWNELATEDLFGSILDSPRMRGGEVVVTSNGAPLEQRVLATGEPLSASGLLEVGLLPAGFTWSGEAIDRFGHLVRSQELRRSTA